MLAFKIVAMLLLAAWPVVFMTSFMMFGSADSSDNIGNVLTVYGIILYPILIFGVYWGLDLSLLGLSGRVLFFSSIALILSINQFVGYNAMVYNALRGVHNSGYTLGTDSVYLDGKLLKEVDIPSFSSLSGDFSKSLKSYDNQYTKDKNSVYCDGKTILSANPKTFKIVDKKSAFWAVDDKHIFFKDKMLANGNPNSMSIRDNQYLVTNNIVFYEDKQLEGADGSSWLILESGFSKDHQSIYNRDKKVLEDADTSTFTVYPWEGPFRGFAKDKNSFYDATHNEIVRGVDVASIEALDKPYFKDKNTIYYVDAKRYMKRVEGVNPELFRVTGWDAKTSHNASDGTSLYDNGKRVKTP